MQDLIKYSPAELEQIEAILKEESAKAQEKTALAISAAETITDENVKVIKDIRAELNKDFKSFEEFRKSFKNKCLQPYNDFEAIYKQYITDVYKPAEAKLKSAVDGITEKKRARKMEMLRAYFDTLAGSKSPEVAKLCDWDAMSMQMIPNINKDVEVILPDIEFAINNIERDLQTIERLKFEDEQERCEVVAEYSACRNLNEAMRRVSARREAVARVQAEQQAKKVEQAAEKPVTEQKVEQEAVTEESKSILIRLYDISDADYKALKKYLVGKGIDWEEVV